LWSSWSRHYVVWCVWVPVCWRNIRTSSGQKAQKTTTLIFTTVKPSYTSVKYVLLYFIITIIIIGKTALLGYSLPSKILPHLFVQLWIRPSGFNFFGFCNNNFFYRARSSALHPPPNMEDQVSVFMSPSGPVIPPDTRFPFYHLLRLVEPWWRYSNLSPYQTFLYFGLTKGQQLYDDNEVQCCCL
jgi:hypothetical protein